MKVFDVKGVIKAFYLLLATDGVITDSELAKFQEIGMQLDPLSFEVYKGKVIAELNTVIEENLYDEDYQAILQEQIDANLTEHFDDPFNGVTPRLLIWDMLVAANSDENYTANDKKILRHLVRVLGIEKTVFLEMEQMIATVNAVQNEYEWLQKSNRPYSEIKPLVEEIENRLQIIQQSAMQLVSDEPVSSVPSEIKMNIVVETVDKIEEKLSPTLNDAKERVTSVADKAIKDISESSTVDRSKKIVGGFISGFNKGRGKEKK